MLKPNLDPIVSGMDPRIRIRIRTKNVIMVERDEDGGRYRLPADVQIQNLRLSFSTAKLCPSLSNSTTPIFKAAYECVPPFLAENKRRKLDSIVFWLVILICNDHAALLLTLGV